MQAFTKHSGFAVPLERVNVDTDQIIPKQFLKSIKRTGFGDYLFDAWRFNDAGELGMTPNERAINHEFVLNEPKYQGASILLAGENFGCGSSREHAVWSLLEYGFSAVIAPSFADIFYGNCFKNGILPIQISNELTDLFFKKALSEKGLNLTIDLERQMILDDGDKYDFKIDEFKKHCLLKGLDDIGLTLEYGDDIKDFEKHYYSQYPWLTK